MTSSPNQPRQPMPRWDETRLAALLAQRAGDVAANDTLLDQREQLLALEAVSQRLPAPTLTADAALFALEQQARLANCSIILIAGAAILPAGDRNGTALSTLADGLRAETQLASAHRRDMHATNAPDAPGHSAWLRSHIDALQRMIAEATNHARGHEERPAWAMAARAIKIAQQPARNRYERLYNGEL